MKIYLDATASTTRDRLMTTQQETTVRELLTFEFPDDTSFVLNEPHGFMRVMPNRPPSAMDPLDPPKNYYFNMAYVIAIGP